MPFHKEYIFEVDSLEELIRDLKIEFAQHLKEATDNEDAANKRNNTRDQLAAAAAVAVLMKFAPVLTHMVVRSKTCPALNASSQSIPIPQSQTVDGTGALTSTETTSDPISTDGALPRSRP